MTVSFSPSHKNSCGSLFFFQDPVQVFSTFAKMAASGDQTVQVMLKEKCGADLLVSFFKFFLGCGATLPSAQSESLNFKHLLAIKQGYPLCGPLAEEFEYTNL